MSLAASPSRADQIATLLAAPPPRPVPADLRRAAKAQAAPVFVLLFGIVFAVFGLVFVGWMVPWNFYRDWQLAADDTLTASGRVVSVANTKLSIDHQRVVRYQYSFRAANGGAFQGECFTTGRRWSANAAVTVRYRPDDPSRSCIAGARSSEGSWAGMFVLIFPAIGIGLLAWAGSARRRAVALLENGFLAEALVIDITRTNTRVNGRYVQRITLQRTDTAEGGTFVIKQSAPEVITFALERKEAQQPVFVLYDPARPKRALLPEAL